MKKWWCACLLLFAIGCGQAQVKTKEESIFLKENTVAEIKKETQPLLKSSVSTLTTQPLTFGSVVKRSERCILISVQKGHVKKAVEFAPTAYQEGSVEKMIEDLEKSVYVLSIVKGRKDAALEKGTPWSPDEEVVLTGMHQNSWLLMDSIDLALKTSSL